MENGLNSKNVIENVSDIRKIKYRDKKETLCYTVTKMQEQLTEVFYRKGVLKNFANITGKHL